jgi:hypothetical protein
MIMTRDKFLKILDYKIRKLKKELTEYIDESTEEEVEEIENEINDN